MTCLAPTICLAAGLYAITDGDTIRVPDAPNIRLWGIDAAEMDEPGGQEAKAALEAVTAGRALVCMAPPSGQERDRYGRAVRLCTLPDGSDIACLMVAAGHAADYRRYSGGHYQECEP